MQQYSLFGHLATRFSAHPENLATESLHYILNRSSIAKEAFLRYVAQADVTLSNRLSFQTQMTGQDQAIPDLVGLDSEGRQILIGEAKFWAGLTDNQPVTYLQRLPEHVDGILLFIAPAKRFPTLWNELLRRCAESGFMLHQQRTINAEFFAARVSPTRTLALISWRSLLAYMLRALESEGQSAVIADVLQLQGLCARMDDQAFLPLRSEEITGDLGMRVHQYCQLADEVTHMLVVERLASVKGLRPTGGSGWYGRYLKLYEIGCFLHFSAYKWSHLRATPMWLRVTSTNWDISPEVKEALSSLELEDPPRLLVAEEGLLIPLDLPLGVEKDQVVAALAAQVREIAALLQPLTVQDRPDPA